MFTVTFPPGVAPTIKNGEIIPDPVDKDITYKAYQNGPNSVNLVLNTNPLGTEEQSLAARFKIHLLEAVKKMASKSTAKPAETKQIEK